MELKRPSVTIGAVVLNSQKQILLLNSPKWHGRYILPCGHVEFGETLVNAVRREVKEETGLNISNIKFLKIIELINSAEYHDQNRHFVCINFTCYTADTKVALNDEAKSYLWLTPEEALTKDLDSVSKASVEELIRTTASARI